MPSDPRLGYALEGIEAIPFLIEDYCNLLYNVLEEELAELKLGNISMQIARIFWGRRARLSSWNCWSRKNTVRKGS